MSEELAVSIICRSCCLPLDRYLPGLITAGHISAHITSVMSTARRRFIVRLGFKSRSLPAIMGDVWAFCVDVDDCGCLDANDRPADCSTLPVAVVCAAERFGRL